MKKGFAPTTLELRKSRADMVIVWEDGHQSVFPFSYLRGFCPCAGCQGHGSGWTYIAVPSPRVVSLHEIGSYAVNIIWDDGGAKKHTTGIYSFDVLRALCPCAECLAAQGEQHPVHRVPRPTGT